jgi:hypothetical protein
MFSLPESFPAVPRASGPVFKFCAPGLVFGGTAGMGSRFHVLRSRTHFWRYEVVDSRCLFWWCRVRLVPILCFMRLDLFSAVLRATGPVFQFCAPGHVFGGTVGIGSRFQVLRSRTRFLWYRGRQVPFSSFARFDFFQRYRGCRHSFLYFELPDSFSTVARASAPVFMFCTPVLFFGGTEGIRSHF